MKLVFLVLLLAAFGSALYAQNTIPPTQTESVFNYPKPGSTKVSFQFWYQKNSRIILEMADVRQLNHIPNLDSLVQEAFNAIKPLKDSLKNDGLARRIDYLPGRTNEITSSAIPPQIRITTYSNNGQSFSFYKDELVQTKIEKDTLRIKISTPNKKISFKEDGVRYNGFNSRPFVILILVDNFTELTTFPTNAMEKCVNKVKTDLGANLTKTGNHDTRFNAYYNMQTEKMFSPLKPKYMSYGKSNQFVPTIQFGLQYGRGNAILSAGAGMQYSFKDGTFSTNYFRALWEPYFFFSRDGNNKLITDRNDFITLKYSNFYTKRDVNKFQTSANFSIGYLVRRRGNWFENNTFKVGIPGVLIGNLMFEPEFFFNDVFRNFSPSLKMTLMFE